MYLSLTQKNAVNIHSVFRVDRKRTDPLKNISLCQLHDLLSIGRRMLGALFITGLSTKLRTALITQNTTTKLLCYLTRTKHDCTSN
jgi:hypothetical protein